MRILLVVAHPDDEVLGCGGTIADLTRQGIQVHSCILSGSVEARQNRTETSELIDNVEAVHKLLGIQDYVLGNFPNIQFNMVPHLKLVQFIEDIIVKTGADIIFTHHPEDLNDDHRITSLACQAAARLFQRRNNIKRLRCLYFIEILSSTDWSFAVNNVFRPDSFYELGEQNLHKKINALHLYKGIMREFPHPRCDEIVKSLAAYRGGQSGMRYAEAFQTAFHALGAEEFRE